jgi:hypothetical protein
MNYKHGRSHSKEYMHHYYLTHNEKYRRTPEKNRYRREHRRAIRVRVLTHYGAKCVCCGEIEMRFLTIDHILGGGFAHLRELKGKGGHGSEKLWRWLISKNYPDGFQVLCLNCNFAKTWYGNCPHRETKAIELGGLKI